MRATYGLPALRSDSVRKARLRDSHTAHRHSYSGSVYSGTAQLWMNQIV